MTSNESAGSARRDSSFLMSASTSRKFGGTGLGLSISYGIIEAHGGQITAISQVGQGTTFMIVLPVDRPQEKYG